MVKKMIIVINDKELIEDYIINNYIFSSNTDGWCVFDKYYHRNLLLQRLIKDIERLFPDMNSSEVCLDWWNKNKNIIYDKVNTHMASYHLRKGDKRLIWEVVNGFGKEVTLKTIIHTLMDIIPNHHNELTIYEVYHEWFDERVIEATKIELGIN
jgi:hypothetical protein